MSAEAHAGLPARRALGAGTVLGVAVSAAAVATRSRDSLLASAPAASHWRLGAGGALSADSARSCRAAAPAVSPAATPCVAAARAALALAAPKRERRYHC